MARITIIYDTVSGHTRKMAEAVREGAAGVDGIEVYIKHVDEASGDDLAKSEGIVVGSPTHCGLMSWKLKKFFDTNTSAAWGKVSTHIGAAFTTSGGLGGGNEAAVFAILNMLLNYGYLVFGLPEYSAAGVTAHYGAVAVGDPKAAELKSCKLLGQRIAEHVIRMHGAI